MKNTRIEITATYSDGDVIAVTAFDVNSPELFATLTRQWEFDSATGETFEWPYNYREVCYSCGEDLSAEEIENGHEICGVCLHPSF